MSLFLYNWNNYPHIYDRKEAVFDLIRPLYQTASDSSLEYTLQNSRTLAWYASGEMLGCLNYNIVRQPLPTSSGAWRSRKPHDGRA